MKNSIINHFKTDRSFENGVQLYIQHGPNMGFKRTLNNQGYSELNHGILTEELRKLAGLSDTELKLILSAPIAKAAAVKKEAPKIEPPKDDNPPKLEVPEHVKKAIRLRDEFPFLYETDCPNELKILVSDMLTDYSNYVEAHKELFEAADNEAALKAVAATVENYLDNKAIWDELNHYKETGEILGKHKVFEQNDVFAELRKLTVPQLFQRKDTLTSTISKKKKLIEENKNPQYLKQRQDSLAKAEAEMVEVKKLLNIND